MNSPDPQGRVEKSILHWKNRLIDLSRRNKLLNFRTTRVTTVEIGAEDIGEMESIFSTLVTEGKSLRFLPTPEPKRTTPEKGEEQEIPAEDGASEPQENQEMEVDVEPARTPGAALATNLDSRQLKHNLKRIDFKARQLLEEQGYNILYLAFGMLEWYEPDQPDKTNRAPLVLVPVELNRSSVRAPYRLRRLEEGPFLNPAIAYKLRCDFRITLPEMPEEGEGTRLGDYLAVIEGMVGREEKWKVSGELFLGLFSFSKFIMFKDMESHGQVFSGNPIVRALSGIPEDEVFARPDFITADELDELRLPHDGFQVLDADSSQQEAIEAVKAGQNLVIQGPPGTGKSQTIANIITEFLAMGKTVLFVSEKMAALEVVQRRLREAGLGDSTLEIHSRKANKRHVVAQLQRAFEQEYPGKVASLEALDELVELRSQLNAYTRALHTPLEPFGRSPFRLIGQLMALPETELLGLDTSLFVSWTFRQYEDALHCLEELADRTRVIGQPMDHPWWGSGLESVNEFQLKQLGTTLASLGTQLEELWPLSRSIHEQEGVSLGTVARARGYRQLFRVLSEEHTIPESLISLESAEDFAKQLRPTLEKVGEFQETRKKLDRLYDPSVLNEDIPGYHQLLETRFARFWRRILSPSYYRMRKTLSTHAKDGKTRNYPSLLSELGSLLRRQELEQEIQDVAGELTAPLGPLWQGPETSRKDVETALGWLTRYQEARVGKEDDVLLSPYLQDSGKVPGGLLEELDTLAGKVRVFTEEWDGFRESTRLDVEDALSKTLEESPYPEIAGKLDIWSQNLPLLVDWTRYQRILGNCKEAGLGSYLDTAVKAKFPPEDIILKFRKSFLFKLFLRAQDEHRPLKEFDSLLHEGIVDSFQELDRLQWEIAKARLKERLYLAKPSPRWEGSPSSELGYLQHQFRLKRNHAPIRILLAKVSRIIMRLTPCFMMSPLSVAQFIDPERINFDIVIFDEASQIAPEDCLGAVVRGRQLVVVGDTRQLPPTPFFKAEVVTTDELDEDELLLPDLESILDKCLASGFPQMTLKWHYRSRHESLIHFSNRNFYGNRLVTFPSPVSDARKFGLALEHHPETLYDRGGSGTNREEAQKIAEFTFSLLREHPGKSIGIAAFSQRQQLAILDALEELRGQDPSLEEHFTREQEPVFVKNLETVQGDERDIILISIGYGRDRNGKLTMNFGPLNYEGGERRLNVLVTRARERVVVFTSILGRDFELSKTGSRGARLLKEYLDFARLHDDGTLRDEIYDVDEFDEDTVFEEAIFEKLSSRGVKLITHIGFSEDKIEFGVQDPGEELRFVLAIESDGERYRTARTARDRDRLRESVLGNLGWHYYRLWSTDWLLNPSREMTRLLAAIEEAQVLPPPTPGGQEGDGGARRPGREKRRITIERPATIPTMKVLFGIEMKPYRRYPLRVRGEAEDLHKLLDSDKKKDWLERTVLAVVKVEEPIHQKELALRLIQQYGMSRAGTRIHTELGECVDEQVRKGRLAREGEFVQTSDYVADFVRTRANETAITDFELIPPSEIQVALILIFRNEFSITRSELIAKAAKVFGFKRTGTRIRECVDREIAGLLERGIIYKEAGDELLRLDEKKCESI